MTDYRTDDGDVVEGAVVFSRIKSGPWDVVAFNEDGNKIVVEDADGDPIILIAIPVTEQSTTGPHIYAADEE